MLIVLQGRVRSTRLPGKGFFTFFGQTIWERMCDIALAVRGVDGVVFATGDLPENHLIRPLVEAKGVRFFAGDEADVLGRYCAASADYAGRYLVRITCDNYLIQPEVIEGLMEATTQAGADYGYVEPLSHYAGEVVRCDVLRALNAGNASAQTREHVTVDIRADPRLKKVALPADYLGLNHAHSVTLDVIEDLIAMKALEAACDDLRAVRCLATLKSIFPAPSSLK